VSHPSPARRRTAGGACRSSLPPRHALPIRPPSIRRLTGLLALLLATAAGPARAQVAGTVRDRAGTALPGAAVELWTGQSRASVRSADAAGRFAFTAEEARAASGLLVRHPGFRTARLQLAGRSGEVSVRLEPEPVALWGVTGRAAPRRLCPNRESPEARSLWTAAASRYSGVLDSLGIGSLFGRDQRTVDSERDVGPVAVSALRQAGVGFPARARTTWPAERAGYAVRLHGDVPYDEFGAWYYPLDVLPAHLGSAAFGALHTLSIQARDSAEAELAFCPRGDALRGRPRLQGLLRVSTRDTLFVDAHYELRTPEPDERAGGEIVYAPAVAPDGRPLPVPATELFWRRPAGSRRFYQRYIEYVGWELGPTGATYMPPLLVPRAGDDPIQPAGR